VLLDCLNIRGGNTIIHSCVGSTGNEQKVGLLHVQKGKYFHEALGLAGESELNWKGLPTEPYLKKRNVCLGKSSEELLAFICYANTSGDHKMKLVVNRAQTWSLRHSFLLLQSERCMGQ
jgi:hypothetical protein